MKRFLLHLIAGCAAIASTLPSIATADTPPRYPTSEEIDRIIQEFQERAATAPVLRDCCGGAESDWRNPEQKQALENFVRAWSQIDSNFVSFLGKWVDNDTTLTIYPSSTPGRVCIVETWLGPQYFYSQGSVVNGKIRVNSGKLKNHILLRQTNPKGNIFLLDTSVENGRATAHAGSDIYTAPQRPKSFSEFPNTIVEKLNNAGCSAGVP
jgi:hypothetical protein